MGVFIGLFLLVCLLGIGLFFEGPSNQTRFALDVTIAILWSLLPLSVGFILGAMKKINAPVIVTLVVLAVVAIFFLAPIQIIQSTVYNPICAANLSRQEADSLSYSWFHIGFHRFYFAELCF
jgi:hypothetical protein